MLLVFVVFQPILGFVICYLSLTGIAGLLFASMMFIARTMEVPSLAIAPILGFGLLPALASGLVAATLRGTNRFWLFYLGATTAAGLAELSIALITDISGDLAGSAFAAVATAGAAALCAALSYRLGRRAQA